MPNPATHVLINTALFYPFRKHLGKYWIVFAAFSGLLPDFDFLIGLILKYFKIENSFLGHGGFFHSFAFPIILLAISLIIYYKNKEYGKYGFILAIGSIIHILTDFILGGGAYALMLFYPISTETFRLHILESYKFIDIYGLFDAFLIMLTIVFVTLKIKFKREKQHKK